ncbi:hypothetical protein H8959_007393 [Pygathrix nigripes]
MKRRLPERTAVDKSSPHLAQAELCPLQGFGAPWPRVRGRRGEAVRLLRATDSGRTRGEMQGQAPLTTQPAKWAVAASACQGPTGQSPTAGLFRYPASFLLGVSSFPAARESCSGTAEPPAQDRTLLPLQTSAALVTSRLWQDRCKLSGKGLS